MKKRLFLLECSAPHWPEAAGMLAREQVEIAYWTAWHKQAEPVAELLPSCIFHDTVHAKRGLGPDGQPCPLSAFDEVCEQVWREDAQLVYDQMNKFDHSRDLTFVERSTLFLRCLVYWREMLRQLQPELVVFAAVPHVVYDYIALCLCRALGVKTLVFENIPLAPPYSMFMQDHRVRPPFPARTPDEPPDPQLVALLARLRSDYRQGMPEREKKVRADLRALNADGTQGLLATALAIAQRDHEYGGAYGANEKVVNVSSLFKERGRSLIHSFEGDYANSRYLAQLLETTSITEELGAWYHAHATDVSTVLQHKFVYFPLAGQPERTSNPQADIFTNQLLAANLLAHGTPADWLVVAKEHPNQFHPRFAGATYRSQDYYEALLNIPGAVVVPNMSDSFDLIDRSMLVATTGGTAAMEAVARGKPALLFGDSWYHDCPGVYRVRSLSEVRAVVARLLHGETLVRADDFLDYMHAITQASFKGIADYPPDDFVMDEAENVRNLVRIVLAQLS